MKNQASKYDLTTEAGRVRYLAWYLRMPMTALSLSLGLSANNLSTSISRERDGLTLTALALLYERYGVSTDWVKYGVGEPFIKKEK